MFTILKLEKDLSDNSGSIDTSPLYCNLAYNTAVIGCLDKKNYILIRCYTLCCRLRILA